MDSQGSIFSTAFSPPSSSSPPRLLTASDDRTLRLFPIPPFDTTVALESGNIPAVVEAGEEDERATLWGHEGRVWRAEWVKDGKEIVSIGEVSYYPPPSLGAGLTIR
jgi:WD40 repeat protein